MGRRGRDCVRQELLDYMGLAVLGLPQSLSDRFEGRQVKVWDQVICGPTPVEGAQ